MGDPTGEAGRGALKLGFDRRLVLQFRGSVITSDGGLLVYRELDDTLGLTDTGADTLADARTGKNGRHLLVGLLRQSVFGRLAGYEDVNDAEQLCRDPAMRWVVGDPAIQGAAASASQMGRFETEFVDLQPHEIAAPEFAVDREVEQGQVAGSALHLEPDPDRPHVLRLQRALLPNEAPFVPGIATRYRR